MKALEYYRKKNGLNQSELADMVGVTFQTISNYETGRNNPTVKRYKQLAKALNIEDWTDLTKEI